MASKKKRSPVKPTVALCYIRQSYSRDEDDGNSPERQRSNIELVCERNNWIPEWYIDVGGHRSGTSEDKRPQWLALKKRLNDPDVVAVVANDLSRLHRNLARLSLLIETLEKHEINLVLAATNSDIDVTTLTGQMFAQMRGLMDAFYAKDISVKAKDSIAYRKRQGKTVGIPPFGTIRNDDGYLMPSPDGAWLLPDGTYIAGTQDSQPEEGAIWRGYYDCTHEILKKYAAGNIGAQRISYEIDEEGWAFRSRNNEPRPITKSDVRRVIGNWAEYGGIVSDKPSKARPAYDTNVDDLPFVEERAVFPIELLVAVARNRQKRSYRRPTNHGVNRNTRAYALAGLVYCAHCDQVAEHHQNSKFRKRLRAMYGNGKPRYRHVQGAKCGSHNRSIRCEELDAEFGELIQLLDIRPEAINLMIELAIQSDRNFEQDEADFEKEKQEAIALCRRRIDAAIHLYRDGTISREDYLQDVERNEREIAHWQARTTETQKLAVELTLCIEAVKNVKELWDISDNEERKALARNLFTEVVYDLDTRRIVDFKLKPWADKFLVLRGTMHGQENGFDENDPAATPGAAGTGYTEGAKSLLGGI